MTRAVVTCFHCYQPYGHEFYEPIFSHFKKQMETYKDEYDKLYIIEDTVENANLRYYDQYKKILPEIKEDLVLFMDNDMVVYKKGIISTTFDFLFFHNVVSIYDTIGNTFPQLHGKSKWCPYWFASKTALLRHYSDSEWGPHMPEHETLGGLTRDMLKDGITTYEIEEDKSDIYYNGNKTQDKGKNLGYYHVRAGSTPAYLLAEKKYGNPKTYWDYINNQPKTEYLRQCAWYQYMGGKPSDIIKDSECKFFDEYYRRFLDFHGL